jgi:hypothetical protein
LVIRPATNAAAISLLLRGSLAKARVALEGAPAISRAGRAGVGFAPENVDVEGFDRLLASRFTVARLTARPASRRALRIASQV